MAPSKALPRRTFLRGMGATVALPFLDVEGIRSRRFSVALDCVNMVKDYVQGRKLIEAKSSYDRSALQDASVPLKSLAA